MDNNLPYEYVSLDVFNAKVEEYAKENKVLYNILNHPNGKVRSWQDMPAHLIQDLFKRLGCKPIVYKY